MVWCQLLGKLIPQIALRGLDGDHSVENDQLAVTTYDHSVEANGVGHVALLGYRFHSVILVLRLPSLQLAN